MHKNPAITMHEYQRKLDDTFPTTEDKFMMAFALLDDNVKHSIWNDRHFRWVLQSRDYTVEKKSKLNYPLHPCRKEEIARLYPAEVSSTDDQIWDLQEQGHLFCYEEGMLPERMRFYEKGYKDYATFSINIYSCASKVTMFDGSVVGGPDAPCEFDQQKILESINNNQVRMVVVHNQESFDKNEFNDDRIKKHAELKAIKTFVEEAEYVYGTIDQHQLHDKTGLLQMAVIDPWE